MPMPAWLFVTLYGVLELHLGITGTQAGVAHFAHLGGMIWAWLLIQYWRGELPLRLRQRNAGGFACVHPPMTCSPRSANVAPTASTR